MKKIAFNLILLLLGSTTLIQAQSHNFSPEKEEVQAYVSKSELCIIVPEIDEKYVKRLTRKEHVDSIANYKEAIHSLHTSLEKAFQENWNLHKNISIKSFGEVLKMSLEEKNKLAFVLVHPEEDNFLVEDQTVESIYFHELIFQDYSKTLDILTNALVKGYNRLFRPKKDSEDRFLSLKFCSVNYSNNKKGELEFQFNDLGLVMPKFLNSMNPSEAQLDVALNSVEQYFRYCLQTTNPFFRDYIKQNILTLKEKELLVLNTFLGDEMTEEEFKLFYPYQVSFVDETTYNNAILNREKGKAILAVEPCALVIKSMGVESTNFNPVYAHYIYSTEDFKIIGGHIPLVTPYKYTRDLKVSPKLVDRYVRW